MPTVKIATLTRDARNANKGTQRGAAMLEKSLRDLGAGRSILIDKNGAVIAGNKTLETAAGIGLEDCIVVKSDGKRLVAVQRTDIDIDSPEGRSLAIADNRTGQVNLDWDASVLADLGAELDLTQFWKPDELAELLASVAGSEGGIDPDADPDAIPESVETRCKSGDLWRLGDHRLICGDCTDTATVARLLDGAKPPLCVTDPPYGVDYDPEWRNEADRANGKPYGASAVGLVANDNRADWSAAWALFPGDVIYSWHPPGATSLVHAKALQDSGFDLRMQIIWAKSNFPIGRGDYHVKHEPCWYAVRKGQPAHRTNDRTQSTLWEIDKPMKSETGHSTQKPVECMARPIRNHTFDSVYDPFVGSGTTLIAAQMTGRACFACELMPNYCDIALTRWETLTGRTAELIEHGAPS
jgi:DNA modification methylase